MEEGKIQTTEHTEETHDKKKKLNKPTLIGIILLVILGVGYFVHEALMFQSTDDAYVETTTVSVAPRVSGQIVDVMITDNQPIEEGDEIAKIDDTDYKVALDAAKARYERILLNQENAKANYSAMQSAIDSAKADLDRYKNLYAAGAVSKQALDNAQTKYDSAVANLTNADQALLSKENNKVADADLKEAKADSAVLKLKSYDAMVSVANGQATKIIVPSELQNLVTAGTVLSESFKEKK